MALNGGKYYLASKIVALMPPHLHYVEPFCGGGAVLLAHDGQDRSEMINDTNGLLINFWRVLQDKESYQEFSRQVGFTPLCRTAWEEAKDILANEYPDGAFDSPAEKITGAWAFFVFCRQSLAGRMKGFTSPTRTRLRRGMNGNVSEWLSAVDGLPEVHARLRRVFVENMDALKLIPREDTPDTLFYCDPPYLHSTRATTGEYGDGEMTEQQHLDMLGILRGCRGKVMLSGYPSALYDSQLKGWTRHTFDLPNNAAGGRSKGRETEVLWCNF